MYFWDPFEEMRRMRRLFSDIEREFDTGFRTPAMDMFEKDNEIVVIAELPGVNKEDIEINCDGKVLTISARSKLEKKEEKKNYYFAERSATSFSRTVTLPCEVDPQKATTSFNNGVLEIHLPKKEAETKGFRIPVK
ncbi:MAG: Hsp20/alpha crystallin family protein [Candidatus Diapherotrites archaeon]|nr:Hsp20/alpha crystallin family protein [Candidatus Diapherotrites archaeon]